MLTPPTTSQHIHYPGTSTTPAPPADPGELANNTINPQHLWWVQEDDSVLNQVLLLVHGSLGGGNFGVAKTLRRLCGLLVAKLLPGC
ncbi:unnamed protein product [Boreogadus saida]